MIDGHCNLWRLLLAYAAARTPLQPPAPTHRSAIGRRVSCSCQRLDTSSAHECGPRYAPRWAGSSSARDQRCCRDSNGRALRSATRGFNARPRCRTRCAPSTTRQRPLTTPAPNSKTPTKKGFLAPAPSPTAAAGARRAAEYLANPRFEVLSAAITLLSCAAYAFNTLNDLPETVATALPILESAASAFFLAEYLGGSTRGASTRGADQRTKKSSRGLMDKASPS